VSALFDSLARLRRRLGAGAVGWLDRWVYEAIYALPEVAGLGLFNGGYHPPPPGMPVVPGVAPQRLALYDLALRVLPGAGPAPASVLDIGCGAGGGLLYAAVAFPGARLTGVDAARRGIAAARRRLARAGVAAELHVGRAERLPLPSDAFDRVVSISTLMYAGYGPFVAEAARVVSPGGVIAATGAVVDDPLSWTRARFQRLAREHGLAVEAFADITAHAFAAMQAQAAANAALVARLPRLVRGYAREAAVLPGSAKHALYMAGRKKEFAVLLRRVG
jgi:SAM-dependent methyltransferase